MPEKSDWRDGLPRLTPEQVATRATQDRFRRLLRNLRLGNTPAECERLRAQVARLRAELAKESR